MNFNLPTLVAAIIVLSAPLSHAQEMRPGKWQITNKTEMIGGPAKMRRPQSNTKTTCIDNSNKDKPPIPQANPACTQEALKTSGNTASWKIDCPGSMTGEGTTIVNSDSYAGTSVMDMKGSGSSPMKMKSSFTGKRIGDC